jgi:hypothetical protein
MVSIFIFDIFDKYSIGIFLTKMNVADTHFFLDKILNSQVFSNKEALKALLTFLYESSKKEYNLKEIDIAIDFYKRDKEFISSDDTIVRVNIFKLRSLLEAYYLDEGKKDKLVLEIPKGCYNLKFIKKGQVSVRNIKKRTQFKIFYAFLFLSIIVNLIFIYRTGVLSEDNNPVWAAYIKSGKPVYITLGNPFFFRVNDSTPETVIVRDISINSPDELKDNNSYFFSKEKPKVAKLTYPYFSTSNVWPLPEIIAVFAKENIEVRLQALSEMNVEDLKHNNSIFLANINSFGYLTKFLEQTSIRLHTNPKQIIVKRDKDSLVLSVPEFIHGYYMDYAFMVKIPGPQNNLFTIMGDFHGSGIKGLTNYITSPTTLTELRKKIKKDYGKFPEYFEMVVKVVSYDYADFKTELIYFKPISN